MPLIKLEEILDKRIDKILLHLRSHEDFKPEHEGLIDFIERLKAQLKDGGQLSFKQIAELNKYMERHGVE